MKLIPVSLAIFYKMSNDELFVWVQTREDDGPYHGLQEFPGGGIEIGETPLDAIVREVEEEVGITISAEDGKLFGVYRNEFPSKTILLNVFLFPDYPALSGKGQWLSIKAPNLSSVHQGIIPPPNHKIIDDLFLALIS